MAALWSAGESRNDTPRRAPRSTRRPMPSGMRSAMATGSSQAWLQVPGRARKLIGLRWRLPHRPHLGPVGAGLGVGLEREAQREGGLHHLLHPPSRLGEFAHRALEHELVV